MARWGSGGIDGPRWYGTLFCAMANLLFRLVHRLNAESHGVRIALRRLNHLADQVAGFATPG